MKVFYCFSTQLCRYLYTHGFKHIYTKPNSHKPWLDVWVFEDTEDLRQAISTYSKIK